MHARAAKTGESYAAAAQLLGDPSRTLHVTNGDSTVDILARTGLAERILPWRDMLHEGPVPDVPEGELRRVRAAFLADHDIDHALALRLFEERDRELADNRDGRFVLWFEADLYDQLQIIQILARLAALGVDPRRIGLICIGEYPGIAHFGGLGQLEPEQLCRCPPAPAWSSARPRCTSPPTRGRRSAHRTRRASARSPAPTRPSCASSPTRSTGSAASTPRRATAWR